VVLRDGQRLGFNTDVAGIVTAVRQAGVTADENVVVLGGGATACSAVAALRETGTGQVAVAVRDPGRAGPLLAVAARLDMKVELIGLGPDLQRQPWQLLLSTIPAAATGPLASQLSAGVVTASAVFDVGYDPWPTPLAHAAAQAGKTVISGYEMLVYQAAGQVELMTGRLAPVAAMHAAGLAELARRRESG
jgi:shikimate dehydrogenase